MRSLRFLAALVVLGLGCHGDIGDKTNPNPTGGTGGTGATGAGGTGATGAGGTGAGGTGATGGTVGDPAPNWLPVRVRRLSARELEATLTDLLGFNTVVVTKLPPDVEQRMFTMNADLRIDAVIGDMLVTLIDGFARQAVATKLATLVTCNYSTDPRGCVQTFIASFVTKAYRRPITAEEKAAMLGVYDAAVGAGGSFQDAVTGIINAALRSPNFLFVTELGRGTGPVVQLDPYETASSLSFLVGGTLPDAMLLDAAMKDTLRDPDQRAAHVMRLLSGTRGQNQIKRFIREWLDLYEILTLDRRSQPVDFFYEMRYVWQQETDDFIKEVFSPNRDGSLATLLTADFTIGNSRLRDFYLNGTMTVGAPAGTVASIPLTGTARRGILTQSNFLMTWESTDTQIGRPVRRGKAVLNQILCKEIEFPTDQETANLAMLPPPARPGATTRELSVVHASDPRCTACHTVLDPIGFAFENFDVIGAYRTTENGKMIDPSGQLRGTDVDGTFKNAAELLGKLAMSEQVRECFAKNFFRFASAQSTPGTEAKYLETYKTMPADARGKLVQLLLAYVRSDMFLNRRVP